MSINTIIYNQEVLEDLKLALNITPVSQITVKNASQNQSIAIEYLDEFLHIVGTPLFITSNINGKMTLMGQATITHEATQNNILQYGIYQDGTLLGQVRYLELPLIDSATHYYTVNMLATLNVSANATHAYGLGYELQTAPDGPEKYSVVQGLLNVVYNLE